METLPFCIHQSKRLKDDLEREGSLLEQVLWRRLQRKNGSMHLLSQDAVIHKSEELQTSYCTLNRQEVLFHAILYPHGQLVTI